MRQSALNDPEHMFPIPLPAAWRAMGSRGRGDCWTMQKWHRWITW